jgi:hypothetical protein
MSGGEKNAGASGKEPRDGAGVGDSKSGAGDGNRGGESGGAKDGSGGVASKGAPGVGGGGGRERGAASDKPRKIKTTLIATSKVGREDNMCLTGLPVTH